MATSKKQLLTNMFLLLWQYDRPPEFGGTDDNPTSTNINSVEDLLLKVYSDLKQSALSAYPWRSAIKYTDLTLTVPVGGTGDTKYKYSVSAPSDFLVMNGFWRDSERNSQCHNEVEMSGTKIRSNLNKITMSYIADVVETQLDPWVIDWLKIYIASEAADVGGQSADRKNFLLQKKQIDFIEFSNKDYEMAHHDEISESMNQFLIS